MAARLLPTLGENHEKRSRSVPMQVLNFSFPRTGTTSLSEALTHLGIESYHSFAWFDKNFDDLPEWRRIMDAKFNPSPDKRTATPADFDHLLSSYGSISEFPACVFVRELLDAYPDTKVILVDRDIESWFTSFDTVILQPVCSLMNRFLTCLDPFYFGPIRRTHDIWFRGWFGSIELEHARAQARIRYRDHYKLVKELAGNRLLVFKLEEGWEPLCRHVGKAVPIVPFPTSNEKSAMQDMFAQFGKRFRKDFLCRLGGLVVVMTLVWYLLDFLMPPEWMIRPTGSLCSGGQTADVRILAATTSKGSKVGQYCR